MKPCAASFDKDRDFHPAKSLWIGKKRLWGSAPIVLGSAFLMACGPRVGLNVPRNVAYGPAPNCPEQPVGVELDGMSSPDALNCSYEDAVAQDSRRIRGTILGEASNAAELPTPLEGMYVAVLKDKKGPRIESYPEVAHSISNAQGGFEIAALLKGDDYLLVVRPEKGGEILSARPLNFAKESKKELLNVQLMVPLQIALSEPKATLSEDDLGPEKSQEKEDVKEKDPQEAPASIKLSPRQNTQNPQQQEEKKVEGP